MHWFRKLFQPKESRVIDKTGLTEIRNKFQHFMGVLEYNNLALKTISDMEEKSQGDYLFDINFIRTSLHKIYDAAETMIANLIKLGGDDYVLLTEQYVNIKIELEHMISNKHTVRKDRFTYNVRDVSSRKVDSVGNKMAQLGELISVLDIPVPIGFCITAWGYMHFLKHNKLEEKIAQKIKEINIANIGDLDKISHDVRHLIYDAEVPKDLAEAMIKEFKAMSVGRDNLKISVRSSAIGEDGELSFAGQYATFLNVTEQDLLYRYKGVLAGKFTPRAVYYFLSHSLNESELAMSAGCLEMVDSKISGVVYTCDPVHPDNKYMIVNSIFGQGEYLVDGSASPDVFIVSRRDKKASESVIAEKKKQLVLNPEGGTIVKPMDAELIHAPSLNEEQIAQLITYAEKIETHYGEPQDIEFTIDQNDRMYIMQTRPLHVMRNVTCVIMPDTSSMEMLAIGGTTVCPGGGIGRVFHVRSHEDLPNVPDNAIVVASNPFPELITVMEKAAALITRVGGVASHMATIAREYRLPSIVGNRHIDKLIDGQMVTVDATNTIIYEGCQPELVAALQPEFDLFDDNPVFSLIKKTLAKLSPLNLMKPSAPDFTIENCRTVHDVIRFSHQKAMDEMFRSVTTIYGRDRIGMRLKTNIPIEIDIINIDDDIDQYVAGKIVNIDEVDSDPLKAFWEGIEHEGWPGIPHGGEAKYPQRSVATNLSVRKEQDFSRLSFAIVGKEFMILSLKTGFHFMTFEAMCTSDLRKNYAKMQIKDGGAAKERRIRRIKLMSTILSKVGFENSSRGDFLDTKVTYESKETILERLHLLGRMSMLTKQLDMALSNDSITDWYTRDIMAKLGIKDHRRKPESDGNRTNN